MPPESTKARRRPMVRVERTVTGANGAQVTVVVLHEQGRPADGLRALDAAVADVKARATS